MQHKLKIPKPLFDEAIADLHRPHNFAAERVGFFSTRKSQGKDLLLIHCVAYHPVAEEYYIRDNSVGVRIGPEAITEAMARCAVDQVGQLHVHSHGGIGIPGRSGTDESESPPLARSLWNADHSQASGWGILSGDGGWASVLTPGDRERVVEPAVSLIGYPLTVNEPDRLTTSSRSLWQRLFGSGRRIGNRYDRQSFLGPTSDDILSKLRVGIIGLGGGGSHIAQQLAHVGVSHFVLCDHDHISETNLNRTVGATAADVSRKRLKTDIAARQIGALHDYADVLTIGKWEEKSTALLHCDVVIGCVDTFAGRRDLEAFCRRHLIPYVDVGMDVQKLARDRHEIIGQVILSMPGRQCMRCMNFLTDELLAEEARKYGDAGGRPQVVWSNGVICSAAVGALVDLVTRWGRTGCDSLYLNFRGTDLSLQHDPRLQHLSLSCEHYPLIEAGDPVWKQL